MTCAWIGRILWAGLMLLLMVSYVHAAETSDPCDGLSITEVRVDGCEQGPCSPPEIKAQVETVARDALGERYQADHLEAARQRLAGIGFFAAVTPSCAVRNGQAVVLFTGEPNRIVRELKIRGNEHFYVAEIRKRVFLRKGTLLAIGNETTEAQLRRQKETLENFYEREGLVGTEVRVRTEDLGAEALRVIVEIEEGETQKLNRVDITMVSQSRKSVPSETETESVDPGSRCPSFSEAQLKRASGLDEMEVYTERMAKAVRRKIREYLQGWGIEDPRIDVAYDSGPGHMDIQITYRRCHLIQFKVRSESGYGDAKYVTREVSSWRKLLPFRQSGTFDFEESHLGRRLLEADMVNSGHLFAEVSLDYRTFESRTSEGGATVPIGANVRGVITYFVTMGPIVEIRTISFPGMKFLNPEEVLDRMSTKIYDFFGTGGYLQEEQLLADLAMVTRLYEDEGYFQAQLGTFSEDIPEGKSHRTEGGREVFHYRAGSLGFRMEKPTGQNVAYIDVPVVEGVRSRVGDIQIEGCEERRCPEALVASSLVRGSAYSRGYLKKAIKGVLLYYQEAGYPNVVVHVRCSAKNPDLEIEECDPKKVKAEEINLVFQVTPGSHVRVGPIFVLGNFHTDVDVILRDLPKPGEILVKRKVREGERRLRNLGIFNTARVSIVGVGTAGDVAVLPLVVELEESPSQFLDFAVGFESINRLSGSEEGESGQMPPAFSSVVSNSVKVTSQPSTFLGNLMPFDIPDLLFVFQMEYINKNLAGNAQEFRFPFKYGLSTTDPLRLVAIAPTLIDRRLLGSDVHFRQTIYGLFDKARNPFDLLEGGLETEVSQAFGENLYLSGQYNISTSTIRPIDVEDAEFEVPSILNKLRFRTGWQDLDQLTHPSRGFGLFLDGSYINSIAVDDGDTSNFFKYEMSGKLYFNIKRVLVFANLARLGGSFSFEGESLPEVERFRLGGSKGLRGFEDGEVAQYASDGTLIDGNPATAEIDRVNAGDFILAGTHEIRFPLMLDVGPIQFWGAGFFDWGALADSYGAFHSSNFRTSAGFGLRLLLYGSVPIRLDYGFKLERRCKIPDLDTGVCLEEESPGEFDFNLLYTF